MRKLKFYTGEITMSKIKESKELKETQNGKSVEAKETQSCKSEEEIVRTAISGEEIAESIKEEISKVKKRNLFSLKEHIEQIACHLDEMSSKKNVFTSINGFGPYYGTDYCGGFDKGNAYIYIGDENSRSMQDLRSYMLRCLAANKNKIHVEDPGYLYIDDFISLSRQENSEICGNIYFSGKADKLKEVSKTLSNYDISWFKTCWLNSLLGNCVPCMETPDIFFLSLSYESFIEKPYLLQQIAKERNCIVIAFVNKKDNRKSQFEPMTEDPVKDFLKKLPAGNVFNLETVGHDINFVWDTHASETHADGETIINYDLIRIVSLSKVYAYLQSNKEYHYHDNYMEWYVRDVDDDF